MNNSVKLANMKDDTNEDEMVSLGDYRSPNPPPENISLGREILFISWMCLSQMLTQAGIAVTINGGTATGKPFGIENNPGELSWLTAGFSLTVGTLILISGRLGDMYGYKLLYGIGYAWFCVFSLACGFTGFGKSQIVLDVMRALQGIGPAIVFPNSMALIGHYYPLGFRRNLAFGLFGCTAPSGFTVGALFNLLFIVRVHLMAIDGVFLSYFIFAIVCFLVMLGGIFIIPSNIVNHNQRPKFDWIGGLIGMTGLILFNFSWNQGPNAGWTKVYVYVILIVGVLCCAVFYFVEKRVESPLLPSSAFSGDTGFVLTCIAAGWSSFGVWLYYTFLWAEHVEHKNPVIRAVEFVPASVMGVVASLLTVYLLGKTYPSFTMLIAMLGFFIGLVIMGFRPVHQIYWAQKFVSILITPFGMDMSFPAGAMILSNALPKSHQGLGASMVATFQNYAISIGLGIAGTVEHYQTLNRPQNQDTVIHGYRSAFYMGMGLSGLGVAFSSIYLIIQLLVARRNKDKKKASEDEA